MLRGLGESVVREHQVPELPIAKKLRAMCQHADTVQHAELAPGAHTSAIDPESRSLTVSDMSDTAEYFLSTGMIDPMRLTYAHHGEHYDALGRVSSGVSSHLAVQKDMIVKQHQGEFQSKLYQTVTYELGSRLQEVDVSCGDNSLASQLLHIELILADNLMKIDYGDTISHVYNPVDYAYKPHLEYYRKYCNSSATAVMVGMNPGPFGMAQTGVPFGDIDSVTNWLGITGQVGSPSKLHAKRPITGYQTSRKEISGSRLWGFLKEQFRTPSQFFARCFIHNHCPLVYMGPSGKNLTPPQMPSKIRAQVNQLCDEALARSLQLFQSCTTVIGIGRFAEERLKIVCQKHALSYSQNYMMHPSPRNPTANREWTELATKCLQQIGLLDIKPAPALGDIAEQHAENACCITIKTEPVTDSVLDHPAVCRNSLVKREDPDVTTRALFVD